MSEHFLDGYLPYLLQRADQLLSSKFHAELRRRGVQLSEWRVMAVLHDTGPLTIGALTERTLLPQPTTSHAVARLERSGAVERRPTAEDGRRRIVALTPTGQHRAEQLVSAALGELDRTLDRGGLELDDVFVSQLRRIIDALDANQSGP